LVVQAKSRAFLTLSVKTTISFFLSVKTSEVTNGMSVRDRECHIILFEREKAFRLSTQRPKSEPARTCWTDKLLIQTPIEVMNEEIIIDLYEFLLK
jgi:hypothetical protein